jgi:hypothetical protein
MPVKARMVPALIAAPDVAVTINRGEMHHPCFATVLSPGDILTKEKKL